MLNKIYNIFFRSWKDDVMEDQQKTIKRLNSELKSRMEFEHKLIERLNNAC